MSAGFTNAAFSGVLRNWSSSSFFSASHTFLKQCSSSSSRVHGHLQIMLYKQVFFLMLFLPPRTTGVCRIHNVCCPSECETERTRLLGTWMVSYQLEIRLSLTDGCCDVVWTSHLFIFLIDQFSSRVSEYSLKKVSAPPTHTHFKDQFPVSRFDWSAQIWMIIMVPPLFLLSRQGNKLFSDFVSWWTDAAENDRAAVPSFKNQTAAQMNFDTTGSTTKQTKCC